MIWKPEVETCPAGDLKPLLSSRLNTLVEYLNRNNQFYKEKFKEMNLDLAEIKSIDDIAKLPLTEKDDLRDGYPFGLFSVHDSKVAELHVSSGTTGNPTVVGYTKKDLELWSEVMARSIACTGAVEGDRIQVAYGYGLFTGGLGLHYGALELGLSVMPMSSGQTARQIKLMQDFKPRILACTPSYALFIADEMKSMGLDPKDSSWEIGIFGAEPWSDSMRQQIEETLGINAYDIYGLSEIIGPGVSQECTAKQGMHFHWDVFYPEVLDVHTGKPVASGEKGELVITTLTKEAIPLIRYRTRDIVRIWYEPCSCGRTSPRISKVLGRTDDMIVIRGINVFPSQIEHVLLETEGIEPHYLLIIDRNERGMDTLEVQVEVEEGIFSDKIKNLEDLRSKIATAIQNTLSVAAKVTLVEHKTIARSEGKAKRVIDNRPKE